jgi:hypothetical protein
MARLTTYFKNILNNMNAASKRAGGLGTILDDIQYGGVATPATGTIVPMRAIKYATTPAIGTAVVTKAAFALTASAQPGITAGITQPDFPRALSIKGNATMAGDVVIHGTNFLGVAIDDTIALNNSTEVLGAKCFKTITSIDFPARTNASGDTISIGRSNRIGLPVACPNASLVVVKSFDAGAADTGTVTGAATVEGSYIVPNGTLNGTKALELVILV